MTGDKFFNAGGLSHLLRNRTYLGELCHKGTWNAGEHAAILDQALFDAVQKKLDQQFRKRQQLQSGDGGLLTGLIHDSAGNRMTAVHASKKGIRYRYYVSRAFVEGRPQEAGDPARISAPIIEAAILAELEKRQLMDGSLEEAPSPREQVEAELAEIKVFKSKLRLTFHSGEVTPIPWAPRNIKPLREVREASQQDALRTENRMRLLAAVHKARQWLEGLVSGKHPDIDTIARREARTPRSIRLLINLAFLAPDLIAKLIDGSLIADLTVTDLAQKLPISWAEQRKYLGVKGEP